MVPTSTSLAKSKHSGRQESDLGLGVFEKQFFGAKVFLEQNKMLYLKLQ